MEDKTMVMIGLIAGSVIGGYVPVLWGASFLSMSSIMTSAIGALVGIYLAYRSSS